MTALSIIQTKQDTPIHKSRTVLVGLIGIFSILLTVLIVRLIPQLAEDAPMIFSTALSILGAIMVKYIGTDAIAMLAEILQIVFRDKRIDLSDLAHIIEELLLDDNGLSSEQVMVVKGELADKGLIEKDDRQGDEQVTEGVG